MSDCETLKQLCDASKAGSSDGVSAALRRALDSDWLTPKSVLPKGRACEAPLDRVKMLTAFLRGGMTNPSCELNWLVSLLVSSPNGKQDEDTFDHMDAIHAAAQGGHHKLVEIYLALLVVSHVIEKWHWIDKVCRKSVLKKRRAFPEWLNKVKYFSSTTKNKRKSGFETWMNASANASTANIFIGREYDFQQLVSLGCGPNSPFHKFCSRPGFLTGEFSAKQGGSVETSNVITNTVECEEPNWPANGEENVNAKPPASATTVGTTVNSEMDAECSEGTDKQADGDALQEWDTLPDAASAIGSH